MRPEFQVHLLNEEGLSKAGDLAEGFSVLLELVELTVPMGPERDLVVIKLQEASFFAKRGIAMQVENQRGR